jgi:predicted GIY-YIG superfamily endonuclease
MNGSLVYACTVFRLHSPSRGQPQITFPGYALFSVYLLRCSDGTFYAGSCENLAERVAAHNRGEAANWTAKRRPVELVYCEPFPTRAEAIARERQIKRWSHAKKAALIAGDIDRLRTLATRRQ